MATERSARLSEALREMDRILEELIVAQRAKVLRIGREYAPDATPEDLMNPHDLPALARAPQFHFEDGILSGYLSARMALRAGVLSPYSDSQSDDSRSDDSRSDDSEGDDSQGDEHQDDDSQGDESEGREPQVEPPADDELGGEG